MSVRLTVDQYESWMSRLMELGFGKTTRVARSQDNGRWGCNDNITIVVTEMGAVYARRGHTSDPETLEALEYLCSKGRSEFVSSGLLDLLV